MGRYLAYRFVQAGLVVLGALVIVFLMVHLVPGDPVQVLFGDAPVPKEQVEAVRRQLGLDLPLGRQFARYVRQTFKGDLGRSLKTNRPVVVDLRRSIPYTASLAATAMVLAVGGGILFGVVSAVGHNTWLDNTVTAVALAGISLPTYWTGLLFIWAFSIKLNWFPITGQGTIRHLVLPAITLGWYAGAILTRLVRSGMLEVLRQDYVRTARAKGLRNRVVIWRHALKNAAIPVLTIAGLQFGILLGGAFIVETVFAYHGLGEMAVKSILFRDFPMIQGITLLVAVTTVAVNLAVDVLYALVNPQVRYE